MIEVSHVCRDFKLQKPKRGLKGYVGNLFNPRFDVKQAVNDVSFSIEQGECIGYIGSNGAGKSTTIKMLCGVLTPTSGKILVDGMCPSKDRKRYCKHIGVVFGQRSQLWWDIPLAETFELLKGMYGISDIVYKKNKELVYDVLELGKFEHMAVRQLSLGQRMRADFACSVLHDPAVLYLDEPTIGLDVLVKEKIRSFVKTVNKEKGTTIVLTTHDMHDIEQLCKRVILINKGTVFFDGKLAVLLEKYAKTTKLHVTFSAASPTCLSAPIPGVKVVSRKESGSATFEFDPRTTSTIEILDALRPRCAIEGFRVMDADIDSIVRSIYCSFGEGA